MGVLQEAGLADVVLPKPQEQRRGGIKEMAEGCGCGEQDWWGYFGDRLLSAEYEFLAAEQLQGKGKSVGDGLRKEEQEVIYIWITSDKLDVRKIQAGRKIL